MSAAFSLSDSQLRMVLAASEAIPHMWRSRFMEAIADRLLSLTPPTDDEVSEAIHFVSHRMGVNVEVGPP